MTYTAEELLDFLKNNGHQLYSNPTDKWLYCRLGGGKSFQGETPRDALSAALDAHRREQITDTERLEWLLQKAEEWEWYGNGKTSLRIDFEGIEGEPKRRAIDRHILAEKEK